MKNNENKLKAQYLQLYRYTLYKIFHERETLTISYYNFN